MKRFKQWMEEDGGMWVPPTQYEFRGPHASNSPPQELKFPLLVIALN